MKYLIGLDIGTSNVKAVLFDINGNELFVKDSPTEVIVTNGNWQEQEGPAAAAPLLAQAGADETETGRVLWLIAHHHTYDASEETDFRILLEADFLVNAWEDGLPQDACRTAGERLFRTRTGRTLLQEVYLAPPYRAE